MLHLRVSLDLYRYVSVHLNLSVEMSVSEYMNGACFFFPALVLATVFSLWHLNNYLVYMVFAVTCFIDFNGREGWMWVKNEILQVAQNKLDYSVFALLMWIFWHQTIMFLLHWTSQCWTLQIKLYSTCSPFESSVTNRRWWNCPLTWLIMSCPNCS